MGMVQSMAVETFGVVDVEEPKYEVVLKRDGGPVHYEIRRYGKRCSTILFFLFCSLITELFKNSLKLPHSLSSSSFASL